MTATLEAPVQLALTVKVSERLFKPGIGYVLWAEATEEFEVADEAQAFFENRVAFWGGGQSELLERDGGCAEFQVGGWRRVMVELT